MKNFKLTPPTKLDENSGVLGLDTYLKSLERHYFSEVSLRSYTAANGTLDMTIDMRCNMKLLEVLGFHNQSRWGVINGDSSPLKKSLDVLAKKNSTLQLDIEELTLFLTDTSIIIKRIHDRSIPELLDEVLSEIASHYVYFTKGLTEKPYEIFIPVFEDTIPKNITDSTSLSDINKKTPKSYYEFWGVYLESQDDAFIYDVARNMYIPADLDFYI
ncbi:hypothetical protein ACFQZJ_08660 [Maribacter chungangensis]|uniref:Uncharacterized protein n=1 Tax=Maribacter chungangensis TaxID=1069117 RepID=A0ABW3B3F0_9FLAO